MIIVSAGVSLPEHTISSDALQNTTAVDDLRSRCGVSQTRVSLPQDYILGDGNGDVLRGWEVATTSPTELGEQAIQQALAKAGLTIEDVGLVVADTATPYQTCPSEAQRIVNRFGVKIPAFDVVGGIAAIPVLFATCSKWRQDVDGKYIVIVSTNTPSQQINYQTKGEQCGLLGDAAVAFVLSTAGAHAGKVVQHASVARKIGSKSPFVIHRHISVNASGIMSKDQLRECVVTQWSECLSIDSSVKKTSLIVPPQLYAQEATEILVSEGIEEERIVSCVAENGFSFGSAMGVAMIKALEVSEAEKVPVVAMHCGDEHVGLIIV